MYALFWLLLIGLFGALWCGTLVLVFVGKARQSKLLKNCGKVSFTISTAAGLWCAFSFMQDYVSPPSPSSVYKLAFGLEPSSDVANIKATLNGFGDNTQIYLRFRASPQTIQRIAGIGLKPASHQKAEWQGPWINSYSPLWWKPAVTESTDFYIATHRAGRYVFEKELLCYNRQTKIAFYQYNGQE